MPQNALAANVFVSSAGAPTAPRLNAAGQLVITANAAGETVTQNGGKSSALNVTAAAVVKATPGTLHKIVVIAPGTTSGSLVINDLATTSGSAAGNTIFSILYSGLTAGQVITLDWPCATGIAVTGVPGGGSPIYSISFS